MNELSPPHEEPSWPYASLFFFGFFGPGSPEGRRLAWRTTLALGFFIVGAMLVMTPHPTATVLGLLAMPGAILAIGWEYIHYLGMLDELGRAIQLQAFALAYGAAMVLVGLLLAIGLAAPGAQAPSAVWIVAAEPIRGFALVLLARRYR